MTTHTNPSLHSLGIMPYEQAYAVQCDHHGRVFESRDSDLPEIGRILFVEHPPIITVTKRPEAASHVIGSESALAALGVTLHQTDRGGDVTYHGPGQLVCYPIVDLNAAKLRIHGYIRLLEQAVIQTLAGYGITGSVDGEATGVWVCPEENPGLYFESDQPAKICAIGVRVRKWITLHGLSLNLDPNMEHYGLIVPCGLAQRPVTSIARLLGRTDGLSLEELSGVLFENLSCRLSATCESLDD